VSAGATLADALWDIPAVDHHAHGVVAFEPSLDEFRGMFSESPDPAQWPHIPTALTYRRAMAELAGFLGCDPGEDAVYAHRLASDFDAYAASLLRASGTDVLLIDDGYPPVGEGYGWERMGQLAGCPARPVMRIERIAEEALGGGFDEFRERVRAEVASARARGFAGLKTIAAYRTGLDLGPGDVDAAREAFRAERGRLSAKPLLELALWDALEANAADPLPLQVHCGFGDSDLLLPRADPAWLKPAIERYRATPFVLLHCYPFVREAGWLAHVYGNVFFDLSLTIPHVSRPAEMVRQALELAPASKLLYASDASRTPELYLLAARWWRTALAEVLGTEFRAAEAEGIGRMILRENAHALYALG
jgi:predicted TIM-barrel fold metal-dependent hydrolase